MKPMSESTNNPAPKRATIRLPLLVLIFAFASTIIFALAAHRKSASPASSLLLRDTRRSRTLASTEGHVAPLLPHAEHIIYSAFSKTFGSLEIENLCPENEAWLTCIKSLLSEARHITTSSHPGNGTFSLLSKSFPWWFITMLRDASGIGGVNGPWHNLTVLDPPMDFCTIEKIATTQWRRVFCFVNERMEPKSSPRPCFLNQTDLLARQSQRVSRAVVLRDPLERLLSGYLNKCETSWRRKAERHCEPNSVFNYEETKELPDLTRVIQDNPKQMFAAYVDALPLKWNMHFFPQSMYCGGLFRHIHSYDFVGNMDKNFYQSLRQMSDQFGSGNRLPEALEKVFHLSTESKNLGSNLGKETKAPAHVKEYYTPATVRRALQYFAVDYVKLGLSVPDWVNEMLDEERKTFKP